jgi:hypothetical protein
VDREHGESRREIAGWWRTRAVSEADALIAARDRQTVFRAPRLVCSLGYLLVGGACLGLLVLFGAPLALAGLFALFGGLSGQLIANWAWVKLGRVSLDGPIDEP